jgi:hypothetical protein
VTVPVGVPLPAVGVTVAVNVTESPKADVFFDDVTVVVVAPVEGCLDSPQLAELLKPASSWSEPLKLDT